MSKKKKKSKKEEKVEKWFPSKKLQWLIGAILVPLVIYLLTLIFSSQKKAPNNIQPTIIKGSHNTIIQNNENSKINILINKSHDYQEIENTIKDYEELYKNIPNSDSLNLRKYRNRIVKLKKERDQFVEEVKRLAKYFDNIEIKSKRLQKAKDYFQQSDFHKADSVLNINEIISHQNKLLQEKENLKVKRTQIDEQLKTNSEEFITKAFLVYSSKNVNNYYSIAFDLLNKALISHRSIDNILILSRFQENNRKYKSALAFLDEALDSLKKYPELETIYIPPILGAKSSIFLSLGNFDRANLFLNEELKMYESQDIKQNFENYISCIHKIGILNKSINDFGAAKTHYYNAIQLYKNVPIKSNIKNKIGIARVYNSLGNIYDLENDFQNSTKYYRQALNILENILNTNLYNTNVEVIKVIAGVYNNLAQSHNSLGNKNESERYYLKSIKYHETLANDNPIIFESSYAKALSHIGGFYYGIGDFKLSEKYLLKGYKIRTKLYTIDKDSNIENFARELINMGNLYYYLDKFNLALHHYEKSLALFKTLNKTNPKLFDSLIFSTHINLANTYYLLEQFELSSNYYKIGINGLEKISINTPHVYEVELCNALLSYGVLNVKLKKIEIGKELLLKSKSIALKFKKFKNRTQIINNIDAILAELDN